MLLLLGCGKKTVYTYPSAPANEATPEMKSEINEELTKLEQEFSEFGVKINLHELPVVVASLPFGVVGRCQYGRKNAGIFIVLSPLNFQKPEFAPLDDHLFEKEFVRVLLHEIGHCYFGRQHETATYLESPGNSFELHHEGTSVVFDKIPRSLMPAESPYRLPKALRKYYISEIAGKAELTSPTVLETFTDFQVVSNERDVLP